MRTLAIGDIHGCLTALETLLRLVAPTTDDLLLTLGDYVDRGPDSSLVLDRLIELYDAGRLIPLRGNHDEMMVSARDGQRRGLWLSCGGLEALASYGIEAGARDYDRVPQRHWRFLENDCRDWYETDTHLFAHACVEPDLAMQDQDEWTLRWMKLTGPVAHVSGKTLVCGHTKQHGSVPLVHEKTVCLDTGAYDPAGWLTCLHVETGRYWQANQLGQTRSGWLDAG